VTSAPFKMLRKPLSYVQPSPLSSGFAPLISIAAPLEAACSVSETACYTTRYPVSKHGE
jgi:hypothetical protein